jgi:shikimate kinase
MGSGKTTVGQALAELLRWEFVDLDERVERDQGMAVREIFARRGEAEFRQLEHMTLRSLVATCSRPTVIALGGGTFVQPMNESTLHDGQVISVFLELPVNELLRRCMDCATNDNPRPLAASEEEFRRLYEERLPLYRNATMTIDTVGKLPEEIAREIASRLA